MCIVSLRFAADIEIKMRRSQYCPLREWNKVSYSLHPLWVDVFSVIYPAIRRLTLQWLSKPEMLVFLWSSFRQTILNRIYIMTTCRDRVYQEEFLRFVQAPCRKQLRIPFPTSRTRPTQRDKELFKRFGFKIN